MWSNISNLSSLSIGGIADRVSKLTEDFENSMDAAVNSGGPKVVNSHSRNSSSFSGAAGLGAASLSAAVEGDEVDMGSAMDRGDNSPSQRTSNPVIFKTPAAGDGTEGSSADDVDASTSASKEEARRLRRARMEQKKAERKAPRSRRGSDGLVKKLADPETDITDTKAKEDGNGSRGLDLSDGVELEPAVQEEGDVDVAQRSIEVEVTEPQISAGRDDVQHTSGGDRHAPGGMSVTAEGAPPVGGDTDGLTVKEDGEGTHEGMMGNTSDHVPVGEAVYSDAVPPYSSSSSLPDGQPEGTTLFSSSSRLSEDGVHDVRAGGDTVGVNDSSTAFDEEADGEMDGQLPVAPLKEGLEEVEALGGGGDEGVHDDAAVSVYVGGDDDVTDATHKHGDENHDDIYDNSGGDGGDGDREDGEVSSQVAAAVDDSGGGVDDDDDRGSRYGVVEDAQFTNQHSVSPVSEGVALKGIDVGLAEAVTVAIVTADVSLPPLAPPPPPAFMMDDDRGREDTEEDEADAESNVVEERGGRSDEQEEVGEDRGGGGVDVEQQRREEEEYDDDEEEEDEGEDGDEDRNDASGSRELAVTREALYRAREALKERERQLESAHNTMANLQQQQQGENRRSSLLGVALGDGGGGSGGGGDARLREEQAKNAELRRQLKALELKGGEWEEKEQMLAAYMEEGRALALKQAQMEKLVKRVRGEQKVVTDERDALLKEKEALSERVDKLVLELKEKDAQKSNASQSLAAMQAVTNATSDKVTKLEREGERLREEVAAKGIALDKAWAEVKDLTTTITEMKTEKEALVMKLREGGSRVEETQAERSRWEQKEAMLLATQQQLQDSLARAMHEAGLREESLKGEVMDMRRRWTDAVSRAESIQAEAHESATPMLRQLRALQEELRLRAEASSEMEAIHSQRTLMAETAAKAAEAGKRAAEERCNEAVSSQAAADAEAQVLRERLAEATAVGKTARAELQATQEKSWALQSELSSKKDEAERGLREALATKSELEQRVRTSESQLRLLKEKIHKEGQDSKDEVKVLKTQLEELKKKSRALERQASFEGVWSSRGSLSGLAGSGAGGVPSSPNGDFLEHSLSGSGGFGGSGGGGDGGVAGGVAGVKPRLSIDNGSHHSQGGGGGGGDGNRGSSGMSSSFSAVERLHQTVKMKEGEVACLQQRLLMMEQTRDALLDEVSVLSRKAAEMEAAIVSLPYLSEQVRELSQKNELLLDMLGEKTEALETMHEEVEDMKIMYKQQIEELTGRVLSKAANAAANANAAAAAR